MAKTQDEHLQGKTAEEIYKEHHKDGKEPEHAGCKCDACEEFRASKVK